MQSPQTPASAATNKNLTAEGLAMSALGRVLASQDLGAAFSTAKTELRGALANDPLDALIVTCLGGAWLFYVAEKDVNPKVKNFWDALVFVTTSLSVGYASMFAMTTAGKAIASALMTIGPAMAAKALDAPSGIAAKQAAETAALLEKDTAAKIALTERLDALVSKLDALATRT